MKNVNYLHFMLIIIRILWKSIDPSSIDHVQAEDYLFQSVNHPIKKDNLFCIVKSAYKPSLALWDHSQFRSWPGTQTIPRFQFIYGLNLTDNDFIAWPNLATCAKFSKGISSNQFNIQPGHRLSLSLSLSHLTRRILCKILSQPPPSHRTFVRRVISSAEMVRGKYLIIGYYKQLSRILSKYGWVEAVSPPLSLHSKRSAHQSDSYDIFFVVNSWI